MHDFNRSNPFTKLLLYISHSLCLYNKADIRHRLRLQKLCIFVIIKNNALCIIYEISFYCNNLQHLLVNKTLLFHINVAYIHSFAFTQPASRSFVFHSQIHAWILWYCEKLFIFTSEKHKQTNEDISFLYDCFLNI